MLLQWQTQIKLGGFKMDMVKNREIRSKHVKAASVLCNSCVHLKKHLEHKKVLCANSVAIVIWVNLCEYFQRLVVQPYIVDMLGWFYLFLF